jgi:hypothetical protein
MIEKRIYFVFITLLIYLYAFNIAAYECPKPQELLKSNSVDFVYSVDFSKSPHRFLIEIIYKYNVAGSLIEFPNVFFFHNELFDSIKNIRISQVTDDKEVPLTFSSLVSRDPNDLPPPNLKLLNAPPNSVIRLQYEVLQSWPGSNDKLRMQRPFLNDSYFSFFGGAIFPDFIQSTHKSRRTLVQYQNIPDALQHNLWSPFGSFSINHSCASQVFSAPQYKAMKGASFIGGDYSVRQFNVSGKPITVALTNNGRYTDQDMTDIVTILQSVITYQRKLMNDNNFPHFLILGLTKEEEGYGGNGGFQNLTIFKGNTQTPLIRLKLIISHEHFHTWNGFRIEYKENSGSWFREGATDYFSVYTLASTGLITMQEYMDLINEAIDYYYNSDTKSVADEDLPFHDLTTYHRGHLLTLLLNSFLFKNKKHFSEIMRRSQNQTERDSKTGVNNQDISDWLHALAGENPSNVYLQHINDISLGRKILNPTEEIATYKFIESDVKKTKQFYFGPPPPPGQWPEIISVSEGSPFKIGDRVNIKPRPQDGIYTVNRDGKQITVDSNQFKSPGIPVYRIKPNCKQDQACTKSIEAFTQGTDYKL